MTPGFLMLLTGVGLLGTFFTAIAAKSLLDIAWHELQDYCRRIDRDSLFAEIHSKSDQAVIAIETTQYMAMLLSTLSVVEWCLTQEPAIDLLGGYFAPTLAIGTAAYFVVALWIPREIAWWFGPEYIANTWPVWRVATWLLSPFNWLSKTLETMSLRASGDSQERAREKELEDEIRSLVAEGQHEKALDPKLREMIEGVIQLDDLCARDIMRHTSEIDAINLQDSWPEVLKHIVAFGRTRLPVYQDNLDDIIGTLYVKDLFKVLSDLHELRDIRSLLRETTEIPDSMSLHELLKMFLTEKCHLAIVVDEFNATLGLVTIEDVLEEIVGEIVDEDEVDEEHEVAIVSISEGEVLIPADAHLDDINEQIYTRIPSGDDYNTLGGFLIKQLNDIPRAGDELTWQDLRFRVEEATRRQVKRIRVTLPNSVNGNGKPHKRGMVEN